MINLIESFGDREESVYSAELYLLRGIAEIPDDIRSYTEKHHPEYLESPKTWQELQLNESQLTESKKYIDAQWDSDARPVGSIFENPSS